MIAYQDFAPKVLQRAGMFKGAVMETFADALAAANEWIRKGAVQVVTIETVVLPNIWPNKETKSANLEMDKGDATWYQFIRVWYEQK